MRLFDYFIVMVLLTLSVSCQGAFPTDDLKPSKTFRVLCIGNSYSRDAFCYVPSIIEASVSNVSIEMDILQIGGVSLDTHFKSLLSDTPSFILDSYSPAVSRWSSTGEYPAGKILGKKDWDMVIIQEGGEVARSYEITRSNISGIVSYLRAFYPNVPIYYMLNPTHPVGSQKLEGFSSDEEFAIISKVAERLLSENTVDGVIPCGTAIQLARKTYLDQLGDFGHLSFEGRHLQEGIPCLIEALTAAQFIMNIFNVNGSIDDCQLFVDQQWVSDRNIPGQHGLAILGSADDYDLCKRCALNAVASPFVCDFVIQPIREKYSSLFPVGTFILEAHRGFSDEFPENTEIAFRSAGIIQAYSAIETDVQMTKDDELVCMHDELIDRTTNGEGKVSGYKLSELLSFRIAGGIGWNDEFRGKLTVPTFETYLDICSAYGKTPYVELKSLTDKGVKKAIDLLHSKGFKDGSYVLTSFNLHCLLYASSICKTPLEYMKSSSFTDQEIADFSKMDNIILRPPVSKVTKAFVDLCHAWGVSVETYGIGIKNKAQVDSLHSWGVLGGTCNSWKKLGFD